MKLHNVLAMYDVCTCFSLSEKNVMNHILIHQMRYEDKPGHTYTARK